MNKNPVLSVIVANYNSGDYIRDCLESIISQTYQDFEIVVCDDGSRDRSLEIIKEYEKEYPGILRVIYQVINSGPAYTRDQAINQARGEYITTLDSDDYYCCPEKLEREMDLVKYSKIDKNKDVIAFSNILFVREDKSLIGSPGSPARIKEGMILDKIISRNCMIPRDFIMKRSSYFETGGYDSTIPIYEDWDLKIRLAAKHEFYYTGINGTAYRRHGAGLSSAPFPLHVKWLKRIFKKNFHLIDSAQRGEVLRDFNRFMAVIKNEYINNSLKKEIDLNVKHHKKYAALKSYFNMLFLDWKQFKLNDLWKLLFPRMACF